MIALSASSMRESFTTWNAIVNPDNDQELTMAAPKSKGNKTPSYGTGKEGKSPTGVVPGNPGKSLPQKPLEAPAGKGLPTSMKKALAKKPVPAKGL
jgi:hypothetical protein